MALTTINGAKDLEAACQPLHLVTITFPDGSVRRLSTHPLNSAQGGYTYGGNSYEGCILDVQLGALQGFDQGGIDIYPRASLTLADADKTLLINDERAKGFRGATMDITFVLWDAGTSTFSSDSIKLFSGVCDAAQAKRDNLIVSATSRFDLQRRYLPNAVISRRCPLLNPATAAQRTEAANPDSPFYLCGETRSTAVAAPCSYTNETCTQPNRRANITWDPPAGSRSREYTSGQWLNITNNPNDAKYGDVIPVVYGTAWVDAKVVNVVGDGNSTRGEALVSFGEIDNILRVVVNDVELQPANSIDGATNYIVRDPLLRYNTINKGDRDGSPNLDNPYNGAGDPYGNIAAILWVVPRRVADPSSTPRVRVLVRGLKVRVYSDAVTYSTTYSENPAWVLADLLVKAGLTYADLEMQTWVDAAATAAVSINYTDQYGATASHARAACSLVIGQRISAADVVRKVRQGAGLDLVPNSGNGKLQVFYRGTLASQSSAVNGSNDNSPVSSKSLAGVTTNGYVAYNFNKVIRGSLELLTAPNQSSPNKIYTTFVNAERDWQQDSLSLTDTLALALIDREVAQPWDTLGINSLDQCKRYGRRYLAEQNRCNARSDAGGSEIYRFQHGMGTVRVRAGHICKLSDTQYGLSNILVRILQIRPSKNHEIVEFIVLRHDDNFYVDTYGQEADVKEVPQYRNRLERPAYPWAPYYLQPNASDPLYNSTEWTFGVTEEHETAADGTSIARVRVRGLQPVNIFSESLSAPVAKRQGTTASTGGTILGSGRAYYLCVCAKDGSNRYSPPSITCEVIVSAVSNTNTITIPVSKWPTGSTGYAVFCGDTPNLLTFHGSGVGTPSTITLTAFRYRDIGCPDVEFDRMRVKVKRVVHSGLFGIAITSVGTNTITISGAGFTTNEWANYDCSIIAKADGTELPVLNFRVSSNTATVLTVSPNPATAGVAAGDVLVMRSKPSAVGTDADGRYITDPKWANSLTGSGMTTDAEVGMLFRILSGAGRGATFRIRKNSATTVWLDGDSDQLAALDTTTRYIIEEPTWQVIQDSDQLNNAELSGEFDMGVEVSNYKRQTLLVAPFTVDGGDNESFDSLTPMREIYIFGDGGATVDGYHEYDGATVVVPDLANGVVAEIYLDRASTTIGDPIYTGGTLTAGQRLTIILLRDSAASTTSRDVVWHANFLLSNAFQVDQTPDTQSTLPFRLQPDGKWVLESVPLTGLPI